MRAPKTGTRECGGGAELPPRTGKDDKPALGPPSPARLRVSGHQRASPRSSRYEDCRRSAMSSVDQAGIRGLLDFRGPQHCHLRYATQRGGNSSRLESLYRQSAAWRESRCSLRRRPSRAPDLTPHAPAFQGARFRTTGRISRQPESHGTRMAPDTRSPSALPRPARARPGADPPRRRRRKGLR